jgi:hypothetical protein
MQYTPQFVRAADIQSPRLETEDDDIDRLFGKLQQVEPSTSLMAAILSSISRLPKDIHTREDVSDLNLEDYIEKRVSNEGGNRHLNGPVIRKDLKESH